MDVSSIFTALEAINSWLGVEIELILPVMVLVALIDNLTERMLKLDKNTSDRVVIFVAFTVGLLVEYFLGTHDTAQAGIKAALYLGSISAAFHYFARDYILKFFLDFVPWTFKTIERAAKKKMSIMLGVNLEKNLLDDEGDGTDG